MSLVRTKVLFKPSGTVQIPYDYNYDVMKSIYYYISVTNEQFEKFLHEEGYRVEEGHKYKLFNFTLRFNNANFKDDYIEVSNDSDIVLILSGRDDIINAILKGLLHIKSMKINKYSFALVDILKDKNMYFNRIMLYKALSPVITTTKNDEGKIISLKPFVDAYYINLAENLKKKYRLIYEEDFSGPLYFDIDNVLNMKEKSHKVKEFYKRGYIYDLWVETTPKMQRIIYYLGLGENNSTGAGCMSIKKVGDNFE